MNELERASVILTKGWIAMSLTGRQKVPVPGTMKALSFLGRD